jgi:flagellar M-ring protein FliF
MPRTQNPAIERARAIAARLSISQKVFIGAGIITALVGFLLISSRSSSADMAVLYTDLRPTDASEITAELAATNVAYELSDGGATVLVPRDNVYQLRLDMSGKGLPASNDGYALLDKQGITTSQFKQQVDYQRAMEGELARTIQEIDDVETAIVHLALAKDTVFVDTPAAPTASVLVRTAGNSKLSDDAVQGIRHLVASSVRDMTPEAVTITDAQGRQLGSSSPEAAADKARTGFEDKMSSSLIEMVGRVVGADRVAVTVSAELNLDVKEDSSEKYERPDGSREGVDGLISSENGSDETYSGATPAQTGLLGPDGAPIQDSTEGAVTYDKDSGGTDYALDRTITKTTYATGDVKKLSIAVVLDEQAVTAEQADAVAELVAAAAGVDADRGDTVVVSRLPFDTRALDELTKAEEDAANAAASSQMMATLRMGLLALLALLGMFLAYRSVRRARQVVVESIPNTEIDLLVDQQASSSDLASAVAAIVVPETEQDKMRRNVEEFADSRPEQTAQLMRTWLNEK